MQEVREELWRGAEGGGEAGGGRVVGEGRGEAPSPRAPAPARPRPRPEWPHRAQQGGPRQDSRGRSRAFHGEISETKAYFFRQDCLCSLLMAAPWPGARRPQTR